MNNRSNRKPQLTAACEGRMSGKIQVQMENPDFRKNVIGGSIRLDVLIAVILQLFAGDDDATGQHGDARDQPGGRDVCVAGGRIDGEAAAAGAAAGVFAVIGVSSGVVFAGGECESAAGEERSVFGGDLALGEASAVSEVRGESTHGDGRAVIRSIDRRAEVVALPNP